MMSNWKIQELRDKWTAEANDCLTQAHSEDPITGELGPSELITKGTALLRCAVELGKMAAAE